MTKRETPVSDVTAIIVNFNGRRTLNTAVAALTQQSVTIDSIVVVDNGSTDDSVSKLEAEFPLVEVLRLKSNRGPPAARNEGLARVRTRYVVFVDDDVYLQADCVERLLAAMCVTGAEIACPRILLFPQTGVIQADGAEAHFLGVLTLRRGFTSREAGMEERVDVGAASAACYCIDRHAVSDPKLFDESYFFHFEDLEFSLRMRSQGRRIVFDSAAVLVHDLGPGTKGLSFRGRGEYPRRRAYLTLRNRWLTMSIHYQLRTLIVLSPALVVYELAAFAAVLVRGWAGEWVRAIRWLVAHRADICTSRARSKRKRVVGDRELLGGGPIPFSRGFLKSRVAAGAAQMLSQLLNAYWVLARRLIR